MALTTFRNPGFLDANMTLAVAKQRWTLFIMDFFNLRPFKPHTGYFLDIYHFI